MIPKLMTSFSRDRNSENEKTFSLGMIGMLSFKRNSLSLVHLLANSLKEEKSTCN